MSFVPCSFSGPEVKWAEDGGPIGKEKFKKNPGTATGGMRGGMMDRWAQLTGPFWGQFLSYFNDGNLRPRRASHEKRFTGGR